MSQTRIHAEQSEQKELRVHQENWPVTQDLSLSYCTPKWEPEEGKAEAGSGISLPRGPSSRAHYKLHNIGEVLS